MKRRIFLGIAIGGVASALFTRHAPQPARASAINSAERRVPVYIVDNQGDYQGLVRDFHPHVTFPSPVNGQTHWPVSVIPSGSAGRVR